MGSLLTMPSRWPLGVWHQRCRGKVISRVMRFPQGFQSGFPIIPPSVHTIPQFFEKVVGKLNLGAIMTIG